MSARCCTRSRKPAAKPKARPQTPQIVWRDSRSIGLPYAGRLENGVQLPAFGKDFVTANPLGSGYNPAFRRWGSERLVRLILRVTAQYHRLHPKAPRVVIGDMSLQHGGPFVGYGGLGHKSHQNGLDVDIPYPRKDGAEREPQSVSDIDMKRAQDLVDLWVRAGAQFVFVGPNTGLTGPAGIVQTLVYHDDHMHVRLPG